MIHETDAVVVGAGPVGLFTVFQCGMVKLNCHLVDALDAVGGQCAALYPEKPIYDIPSHTSLTGADLISRLEAQAAPFKPTIHLGRQMVGLEKIGEHFHCTLSDDTVIKSRVVIVTAGSGAFGPNRPPLDGIRDYEGRGLGQGVHYFVTRREDFRGKKVVIAGGGDSAVDWAISLSELAASVQVIHRRPKFRAAPESESRLKELAASGKVELVVPYQLHGLKGQNGMLSAVEVATLDGQVRTLEADALLPFFGLATDLGPITGWGLAMDRTTIAVDPASQATSVPGIFAAGDVCSYPGKLKLILTGFAEAARAAHSAYETAHPGEALHFEHSTSAGVPGQA